MTVVTLPERGTLAYQWTGDGAETVVLVNGSVFNYHQWDKQALPILQRGLGDRCRFLQYDYVGVGGSSAKTRPFRIFDLADELRDRFGALPPPVQQLVDITRLRLRCLVAGVVEVKGTRKGVRFVFAGDRAPDSSILMNLLGGTGLPNLTFNAVQGLQMTAEVPRDDGVAGALVVSRRLVELLDSGADAQPHPTRAHGA